MFNLEMDFGDTEMVSMLYYLGFLTILDRVTGITTLKVPNRIMRGAYSKYFLKVIKEENNFVIFVKSEQKVSRNYPDLLLTPMGRTKDYFSVMIEFQYLKKSEEK